MGPVREFIVAGLAALVLLPAVVASVPRTALSAVSPAGQNILPCVGAVNADSEASTKTTAQLDPKVVATLIAWIDAKTGWRAPAAPIIRFVPDTQLRKMFAERGGEAIAAHIDALYSREHDTIYLPTDWNANAAHDCATLLHELIHHLQAVNKVEVSCPNQYEFQAYSLTIDWLHEQGVENPLKVLHVNDVALFMLSQCPVY